MIVELSFAQRFLNGTSPVGPAHAPFARRTHQILSAVDPALRISEVQTRAQADGAVGASAIAPLSDDPVLAGRLAAVTPAIARIMALVGVVAAYVPARRSRRVLPAEAVRAD